MKTVVETATSLSKYLFAEGEVIILNEDNIVVGDPVKFIIADINADTVILYENVTAPKDWIGNKYTFDGIEWALNSEWVEPA